MSTHEPFEHSRDVGSLTPEHHSCVPASGDTTCGEPPRIHSPRVRPQKGVLPPRTDTSDLLVTARPRPLCFVAVVDS